MAKPHFLVPARTPSKWAGAFALALAVVGIALAWSRSLTGLGDAALRIGHVKATAVALAGVDKCPGAGARPSNPDWGLATGVDFFKLKSQSTQDGVLAYLFQHIGVTNKYYVEFGFNTDKFDGGSGSNAYVLQKHFGWTGLLLDGRHQNPAINLHKEFISPDNIASLFDKYGVPAEPDYVSIDIDSIDLWVFRALVQGGYRPRALTIEYNANFPVDAVITQTVEAGTPPGGYDRTFGASLAAIALAADELGYALFQVVQGLDAVLVRKDLVRGVRLRPLETWAACCTNQTVHTIPPPERLGELLDYKVWRDTGDMGTAKQAAREYLAARPYIMSRQQP